MAVVLVIDGCYESFHLVLLLFADIAETDQVNGYRIFLKLLGEHFQGINILSDGRRDKAHDSLLLRVVSPVLEGQRTNLQGLS